MRWRSLFILVLLAALAAGGWWSKGERARHGNEAFLRQRLALLEAENGRLSGLLTAQQAKQVLEEDGRLRREIEKEVAGLRSLPFKRPVVYRQIPRSDLPAVLRKKLQQQVPDQEFADQGVALAALGLLPEGTNLQKTYLGLLGEQVGAFYDQHTQELFTFSGQGLANSQNRVILAHELTHALEDQNFQLANLPLEARGNDDRALAASALVEGDATLVMNQYLVDRLSAAVLKDTLASTFTTDLRQLAAAPRFLRETLLFPYLSGQVFCQALSAQGGWDSLAGAFRQPPSCTAHILHPERFLAQPRWEPVEIRYENRARAGARPVADNVLGEFGVRQWLQVGGQDAGTAADIARGWEGDRYVVYHEGKASSALWVTLWGTPEAAHRFAQTAWEGWTARYHLKANPPAISSPPPDGGRRPPLFLDRLADGRELRVFLHDKTVALFDAQDARWLEDLQNVTYSTNEERRKTDP